MNRIGISLPENLAATIGGATGIIQSVYETPRHHDDARIWSFAASMTDTSAFSDWRCNNRNGGAGLTRQDAMIATVGEAIERYCCSFIDWQNSIVASYSEEPRSVHPEKWSLFSDTQYATAQFGYARYEENTPVRLVHAKKIATGEETFVPACMVYIPYHAKKGETIVSPSISTGTSCHQTLEEALLFGLLECIERDAFSIYWLRACRRKRLNFKDGDVAAKMYSQYFQVIGTEYHAWDITTDVDVPVVFCAAVGTFDKGTAFSVGSACRPQIFDAWIKSMIEIGQSRPYLRYKLESDPKFEVGENFKNVRSFDDHAMVYTSEPELIAKLGFCCDDKGNESLEVMVSNICEEYNGAQKATKDELQDLIYRLGVLGYEPCYVDLTTDDIKSLGMKVVKVFVPGLQQLHGDHLAPFLGGKRLYSDWAQQYSTLEPNETFSYPHPFP